MTRETAAERDARIAVQDAATKTAGEISDPTTLAMHGSSQFSLIFRWLLELNRPENEDGRRALLAGQIRGALEEIEASTTRMRDLRSGALPDFASVGPALGAFFSREPSEWGRDLADPTKRAAVFHEIRRASASLVQVLTMAEDVASHALSRDDIQQARAALGLARRIEKRAESHLPPGRTMAVDL